MKRWRSAPESLGAQGFYWVAAFSGLASASAVALSAAKLAVNGSIPAASAAGAILLAVATNAAFKWSMAWFQGTRRLAFWLGGGLITMLASGGAIYLLTRLIS